MRQAGEGAMQFLLRGLLPLSTEISCALVVPTGSRSNRIMLGRRHDMVPARQLIGSRFSASER